MVNYQLSSMSSKNTANKQNSKIGMKTIKDELFKWVCKKYAMNSSFDKHMLREEALRLMRIQGVKYTDRWLNNILKEYNLNTTNSTNQSGPMFKDYREWIELMRSTIIAYRHKDLFHVDELTMYSDGFPSRILSNEVEGPEKSESPKNRITILMGCNSSGTTKLPLLICGPYPSKTTVKDHAYCQSEDSHIGDKLFRNWLSSVNDRMTKCNRKILLFLRQNRARALKDFVPSNIQLLYFPEDFPPFLRPLRRDVFHYIKMVFRRRYAERLKQCTLNWNLHDILTSLIEAWETTPRELVIFSFQRTHFRTDDCFLQIHCDCWDSLKVDVSFKSFVTFDDDLSDEPVPRKRNNRYNDYKHSNLGSKNVIQINEDTLDSVLEDPKSTKGTAVREESCESVRNCRKVDLKVRNRTHRKHIVVTSHEKAWNDNARHSRFKENPIEVRGKQRKSQKRTYSETQFSEEKEQNDNRYTGQRNVKKAFEPKDLDVNMQTFENISISERHRSEINEIRECLRTIIDKALTTSSTSIANCTKNLSDSTYAANHEITKNTGNLMQFELLNGRDDTKSKCTIRETLRLECSNKIITNLSNCFLSKFNQPSTSTNCSILCKEIMQGIPKENIESHPSEISSSNPFELHEQNLNNNQNLNQIINPNNENRLPSVYREGLNFSKQTRRKSLDLNDPEDNSQTSETREKISKPDNDWSKQFETTFVFGSPDTNCSSNIQYDESNIESRIFNVRPPISPKD